MPGPRKRVEFPEGTTQHQRSAVQTWLTLIGPHVGTFTHEIGLSQNGHLRVRVIGSAGGVGLVGVEPLGKVYSLTTGQEVLL